MRVLVCGGRDYNNYDKVKQVLSLFPITEIIDGACSGADNLATQYANEKGIPVLEYPADWAKYGKSAGYIRNYHMMEENDVDIVIAFAGGQGTENMMTIAKNKNCIVLEVKE